MDGAGSGGGLLAKGMHMGHDIVLEMESVPCMEKT